MRQRRLVAATVATALTMLLPARLLAQAGAPASGRCRLQFSAQHPLNTPRLPSGQRNAFTGGNVVARCPAQGMVLTSDSLESYGDEGRVVFIGHVNYRDGKRLTLKSDYLTYFQREERVLATSNVEATLPSGSTLVGPQVDFLRAIPKLRPKQLATATGRPTISLVQRDSAGRLQPPVKVTGNTVWMIGDSTVAASGSVVVVRPELTATGDSLYVDSDKGLLRIMRQPKIVGTRGRPFTLVGEIIDLLTQRRKLQRVVAASGAHASSEDLDLRADTIDMRVTDDQLQRAIAWGKSRARATSPTQSMISDSMDVIMPGQRVREIHAVRQASTEGLPDTVRFRTTEKDRLTGDTIVAHFDTVPAKDTARKPRLRLLIASGHASMLQHLAARDSCIRVPAQNYTRGGIITAYAHGTIDSVHVTNQDVSAGVYLEPRRDTTLKCGELPPGVATAPTAPAAVGDVRKGGVPATPPATAPPVPPPAVPTTAPAQGKRP